MSTIEELERKLEEVESVHQLRLARVNEMADRERERLREQLDMLRRPTIIADLQRKVEQLQRLRLEEQEKYVIEIATIDERYKELLAKHEKREVDPSPAPEVVAEPAPAPEADVIVVPSDHPAASGDSM